MNKPLTNKVDRNFVKYCIALQVLKGALSAFIKKQSEELSYLHLEHIKRTCGVSEHTCKACNLRLSGEHCASSNRCAHNGSCDVLYQRITSQHSTEHPNWSNARWELLSSSPWEQIKCYISDSGYAEVSAIEDAAISAFVQICCNHCEVKHLVGGDVRILQKIVQIQDESFQSEPVRLTDEDLHLHIQEIKDVLQMHFLNSLAGIQTNMDVIERLLVDNWPLVIEDEIVARNGVIAHLNRYIASLERLQNVTEANENNYVAKFNSLSYIKQRHCHRLQERYEEMKSFIKKLKKECKTHDEKLRKHITEASKLGFTVPSHGFSIGETSTTNASYKMYMQSLVEGSFDDVKETLNGVEKNGQSLIDIQEDIRELHSSVRELQRKDNPISMLEHRQPERMSEDWWTVEKILKLKLPVAIKLAKEWKVDIAELKKLEEILDRLVPNIPLPPIRPNQPVVPKPNEHGIVQTSRDQENVRIELQDKIRKAEKLVGLLPPKLKANMLQYYPNLEADIKARQNSLKIGECWILVTGEVGAGKSSIINLFLECQLLPVDALKCSNTTVEIRCSDIKEARCHFKPPLSDSGTSLHTEPRIIKMNDLRGIQEFKDCVAECDENDDNTYDHIELYYPFKTLSKNVVIVDTPGIEGGSNVDRRLQKYLKSAFGFLYVINTNTAGSVSQRRFGHLLKTVVNSCEEFSPESSLFIGNKWENVPDCNKADVMKDVFDKLSRVYPGIRGHQIHYMSVTKAKETFMKHKTHSQDHVTLLHKICELIPNSLRQGLTNQYWWLSAFLSRTSYVLSVTGVQHELSAEEMKRKYTEMQSHVSDHQADQQLIETLRHDMTQIEEIKEKLPSLATDCAELHGSLDIFYVNKIMKFDFDLEELDWANKQFLGSGSFAEVFSSELKRKRQPVALKVASSPVKSDNVTEILMEDRIMRELRHPNIIRYFGATYVQKPSGLVWIMVMELCNASLKSLYVDDINKDNHVPGMMSPEHPRRQAAVERTLTHCLDIVKGLEYIHEKGYTHRDMKLENVLIGNEDMAKITFAGVTIATSNLVRSCTGSPAYMAPEVLLSTKNQTHKIDIYSLALIYWEMWFGHDVSSDMNREILGLGFQGDALGGWRPSLSHRNRPSNSFIEIIKRSWSDNPDQRPEAKEIRIFLEELIRNN